jgi:4-hydroxymandelate oxidase
MQQHLLDTYQREAEKIIKPEMWQYLSSGSGQQKNLTANPEAWQALKLMPRPLNPLVSANTNCTMFGETWAHPFILAPIAYQKLFHPQAESGAAMAANAQNGQMLVSSLASQPLESIMEAAQQPLWFQLYWQGDRETTLRLVKRALFCGYQAVVFTVDAPVKQALMTLPEEIQAVNLEQPLKPRLIDTEQSEVFAGWMAQAPTWEDVDWLRQQIKVPLLLKGILHPDDALKAVRLGCDGIIVSNHGGRVLDTTPTVTEMLPQITSVVDGKCKIIADSGIRSGQDAFKALTLGADAVCIGRPYVWGLAVEGAIGVAKVIRVMRDELEITMALTGVSNLPAIKNVQLY